MPVTAEAPPIRPFRIAIPEAQIAELRRRIEATRWPSKELVADRSQGVQLATLQALARSWTTEYDWRRCEARLNALPQFTTEISYYKISRAFVDREPVGNLTRDTILDDLTLHWLTGTGASAARWYWEFGRAQPAAGQAPPAVSVPVGFTTFPGELWAAPRSWVQAVYPSLTYFNEVDSGGHLAAWEEPELFSAEVRAAFRSLR
jgi:pimeloyl-ACP methyl ester carboxylesterase